MDRSTRGQTIARCKFHIPVSDWQGSDGLYDLISDDKIVIGTIRILYRTHKYKPRSTISKSNALSSTTVTSDAPDNNTNVVKGTIVRDHPAFASVMDHTDISVLPVDINLWKVKDVCTWLESVGLGKYCPAFIENSVSGMLLLTLTEQDLKEELHMVEYPLHRRNLLLLIEVLRKNQGESNELFAVHRREPKDEIAVGNNKVQSSKTKVASRLNHEVDFTKVAGMSKIRLAQEIRKERRRREGVKYELRKEREKWSFSYDGNPPPIIVNRKTTSINGSKLIRMETRVVSPEKVRTTTIPPPM